MTTLSFIKHFPIIFVTLISQNTELFLYKYKQIKLVIYKYKQVESIHF